MELNQICVFNVTQKRFTFHRIYEYVTTNLQFSAISSTLLAQNGKKWVTAQFVQYYS